MINRRTLLKSFAVTSALTALPVVASQPQGYFIVVPELVNFQYLMTSRSHHVYLLTYNSPKWEKPLRIRESFYVHDGKVSWMWSDFDAKVQVHNIMVNMNVDYARLDFLEDYASSIGLHLLTSAPEFRMWTYECVFVCYNYYELCNSRLPNTILYKNPDFQKQYDKLNSLRLVRNLRP